MTAICSPLFFLAYGSFYLVFQDLIIGFLVTEKKVHLFISSIAKPIGAIERHNRENSMSPESLYIELDGVKGLFPGGTVFCL